MTTLQPTPRWANLPSHQRWLERGTGKLIRFARTAIRPDGGFHYQGVDGEPEPGKEPLCFLTARLVHASAIGLATGIPGSGRLLDHGVDSLLGVFHDPVHGGFHHDLSATREAIGRKSVYDQVQVAMAAGSAMAVAHPRGQELLDTVASALLQHAWSEDEQALPESFAADWSDSEPYRGANSNMHGVEAMLALGDVTGDRAWHERALAVAQRLIDVEARRLGWLIPEHYTADWLVDTEYNAEHPKDPFRPYGATLGHSFEWARFLLYLHQSPFLDEKPWLLEASIGLTSRALDCWGNDGVEGLVYTVDWDGDPVTRERLHWPVCEAIQTAHVLGSITADRHWERWYRRLWDHAEAHFIDARGAWINELDVDLRPSAEIWPGRPDYYHCVGAYTVPRLPTVPFMTVALARV